MNQVKITSLQPQTSFGLLNCRYSGLHFCNIVLQGNTNVRDVYLALINLKNKMEFPI